MAGIKDQIDRQTLPLFDFSLLEVEGGSRGGLVTIARVSLQKHLFLGELASLAGQLAQLVTVLSSLASLAPATSTAGLEELEVKIGNHQCVSTPTYIYVCVCRLGYL